MIVLTFYFLLGLSMWNSTNYHQKRVYINPNNKIWDYIHFDKRDKVLCDFIDYIAFYGCWTNPILLSLLNSDNWPAVYVWRITLHKSDNKYLFTVYWEISHLWKVVRIFRLQKLQVPGMRNNHYLKVDLYWKWVKLIREEGLRDNLRSILVDYCGMSDIVLTRVDYTVDCAKYNFNKPNKLKNISWWNIFKIERWKSDHDLDSLNKKIELNVDKYKKSKKVQYLLFGNKSSSTARFIRYYDKKAEIVARWTQYLYPEYFDVPEVMRYELQVNSKWLDDEERRIKVDDLLGFINFWYTISNSTASHHMTKNLTLYEYIAYWIRKLKRERDTESLEKIKLLLFDPQELWDMDYRVWCETLDREKPSELS